jgi:CubicO group peptidase (beta-lactamase class C family)
MVMVKQEPDSKAYRGALLTPGILLALVTLVAPALAQQPPRPPEPLYPVTGKAVANSEVLDKVVVTIMSRHGIPGAALAIARNGKLVFARGYGWANLASNEVAQPDTLFGLASLSKPLTAAAVLKLVDQGKLGLDDRAFDILDHIKAMPGTKVDPRLSRITVRQLLNHSGGWNHQASGDPVNWTTQMQLKRGDRTPVTAEELISFTMSVPLDFEPGTDSRYSNFGFIVLGEVVAKVSGQPYEKYVRDHVLAPMGSARTSLHPLNGQYFPKESRRYLTGTENELPPWQQKYSDAAGGWTASAVDMVRFLTALDGSRGKAFLSEKTFKQMIDLPPSPLKPRENGTYIGLGWDSVIQNEKGYGYFKDGSWHGMRSYMKRLQNGTSWALLFNASMQPDVLDMKLTTDAVKEIRQEVERLDKFPDIDLFAEFP